MALSDIERAAVEQLQAELRDAKDKLEQLVYQLRRESALQQIRSDALATLTPEQLNAWNALQDGTIVVSQLSFARDAIQALRGFYSTL
jgi:hypothetical protein